MSARAMQGSDDENPTLREEIDRRQAAGECFEIAELVASMVPFISELQQLHDEGERLFVHPSSVRFHPDGSFLDQALAAEPPSVPADRSCLAPEVRGAEDGGDARASVYACGAILYEMATGEAVGPGMRRPSELSSGLPVAFEVLLGKALVGDPAHRPADLGALAQALHHCAPTASIPPPPADESLLDHDADFDVDVSISMLPPPIDGSQRDSMVAAISAVKTATAKAPTTTTDKLAALKLRLESDPRPRYIVAKDGMDHGPFTAVELLHQIAVRSFIGEHPLRDTIGKEERPIDEWDAFAPFAEQARLSAEAKQERQAIEASVTAEKARTQYKTLIGGGVLAVAVAAAAGFYFRFGRASGEELTVKGDQAHNVDFDGGLDSAKAKAGGSGQLGGGRWQGPSGDGARPSGGAHPVVPDGLSCAGAQQRYVEDYDKDAPPDLTAGAYASVLSRGTYLNACGVPPSMSVTICAAVQNGRAVGVTVSTTPPNGSIARCISGQVRSMGFPSHPRLDVTTTVFKAQGG